MNPPEPAPEVHGLAAVLRRRRPWLVAAVLLAVWLWQPAPVRRVVLNCWVFSWPPMDYLVPYSRYTQDLADPGQRERVASVFSYRPAPPSNALPALMAMLRDDSVSDSAKTGIISMVERRLRWGSQQWARDGNLTRTLVDLAETRPRNVRYMAILALERARNAIPPLLTPEDYRRLAALRVKVEPYERDRIDAILATNPYAPTHP